MKISFITTVYNEEATIIPFLESLFAQTQRPSEIIIVDANSVDKTVNLIKKFEPKFRKKKIVLRIFKHAGNRSVGRNEAIRNASDEIIVCTDAGNILDKKWIEKITEPFVDKKVDVVAGYYKGKPKNVFEKCVIPYALVMPDRVNPQNFLPATRSVAFRKNAWEKVGGFDERLSHNEDYAFAKKLKAENLKIVFQKDAIVYWIPRSTLKQSFIMFFRFAYGDAEAGIFRPKVLFILARYLIGIILLISAIIMKQYLVLMLILFGFFLYLQWAISKNYHYVRHWQAFYYLPLLQILSDLAVIEGTALGIMKTWDTKKML